MDTWDTPEGFISRAKGIIADEINKETDKSMTHDLTTIQAYVDARNHLAQAEIALSCVTKKPTQPCMTLGEVEKLNEERNQTLGKAVQTLAKGAFAHMEHSIPFDRKGRNYRLMLADNIVLELKADVLQYAPPQTVLTEIGEERKAQELKWGQQNHDLNYWFVILAEEIGEAAKELCDYKAKNTEFENSPLCKERLLARARKELIQSAAVIVNMVESLDRNEGAKHD